MRRHVLIRGEQLRRAAGAAWHRHHAAVAQRGTAATTAAAAASDDDARLCSGAPPHRQAVQRPRKHERCQHCRTAAAADPALADVAPPPTPRHYVRATAEWDGFHASGAGALPLSASSKLLRIVLRPDALSAAAPSTAPHRPRASDPVRSGPCSLLNGRGTYRPSYSLQ
jgi:hypothetical protein